MNDDRFECELNHVHGTWKCAKKEYEAEVEMLRKQNEPYVAIVATLAIYGEDANFPALIAKARELNEAS